MKRLLYITLIYLISTQVWANEDGKFSISGHITDENGEALIGASVYVKDLSSGVVSNTYGFYSLKLPEGKYEVAFAFIGYETHNETITLNKDYKLNIKLQPSSHELEAVEIVSQQKDVNIKSVSMSTNKLETKTIKKIPIIFFKARD